MLHAHTFGKFSAAERLGPVTDSDGGKTTALIEILTDYELCIQQQVDDVRADWFCFYPSIQCAPFSYLEQDIHWRGLHYSQHQRGAETAAGSKHCSISFLRLHRSFEAYSVKAVSLQSI